MIDGDNELILESVLCVAALGDLPRLDSPLLSVRLVTGPPLHSPSGTADGCPNVLTVPDRPVDGFFSRRRIGEPIADTSLE